MVVYELVSLDGGEFAVDVPDVSDVPPPDGGRRSRVVTGTIEDCCAWIVLHERGLA